MQKKQNIALIGCGTISKYYINAIIKDSDFNLIAICDIDTQQLNLNNVYKTDNFDNILKMDDVDSIIISLPNYLHYSFSKQALEHKKNVCCEKPLTFTSCETKKLQELAQVNKVVLFTAFHRRYNKHFASYKFKNDTINKVTLNYRENVARENIDKWYFNADLSGGGCLIDSGPNAFDMLYTISNQIEIYDVIIKDNFLKNIDSEVNITGILDKNIIFEINLSWQFETENKELTVYYRNKTSDNIDLLANSIEFKSSMFYEYIKVLKDFKNRIYQNLFIDNRDLEIVKYIEQSYQIGKNNNV